jgi:glycosidase
VSILDILKTLYPQRADHIYQQIETLINNNQLNKKEKWVDQSDIMLITYGDSIQTDSLTPIATLHKFLNQNFKGVFTNIHFLPFFPYSSDDGFSVIDYYQIDPKLGSWDDVKKIATDYDLMFDAVVNHVSKHNQWFIKYLANNAVYADFFIECDPTLDYSSIVRPRALPLFYEYQAKDGKKNIWATFSEDQVDLNFKNPKVLIKILEVLIEYAKNGARFLRLDAVGFIWKELGTSSIHLKEAHLIVSLIRNVLDAINSGIIIITETNVPHRENISYFGEGIKEAHVVYQFPLPPLTLHTFIAQDSSKISAWLQSLSLETFPDKTTFFNFLSSHDGIGVRPVEGILDNQELNNIFEHVKTMGGKISMRNNKDGSVSPYELNITYYDALAKNDDDSNMRSTRFIAAQSLLLALKGIPGIYIHSFLASRNDYIGLNESGINRRINREKFKLNNLEAALANKDLESTLVTYKLASLIELRKKQSAFSPDASQEILFLDKKLISFIRASKDQKILVLINIAATQLRLDINYRGVDLLSNETIKERVLMEPYQVRWIEVN